MKLVMDLVVNHTSDEHPWFVESRRPATTRSGTGTGGDARDGAEPNNWGSFFSGRRGSSTRPPSEYYLHLFSTASNRT